MRRSSLRWCSRSPLRCASTSKRCWSSSTCPRHSSPIVAASSEATSAPSDAASDEARARRKSPARMATMLFHRAFTLGTPRRVSASSITSSWYSDPRCTSSTATAPVIASSEAGPGSLPVHPAAYAAQSAKVGRMRFPPALIKWAATSPRKGSGERTDSWSEVSTRARSAASGPRLTAVAGFDDVSDPVMGQRYAATGTNSKPEVLKSRRRHHRPQRWYLGPITLQRGRSNGLSGSAATHRSTSSTRCVVGCDSLRRRPSD